MFVKTFFFFFLFLTWFSLVKFVLFFFFFYLFLTWFEGVKILFFFLLFFLMFFLTWFNSIYTFIKSNLEPLALLGDKCCLYSSICKYFMILMVPLLTIDDRCIKVLSNNIHLYYRKYINRIL